MMTMEEVCATVDATMGDVDCTSSTVPSDGSWRTSTRSITSDPPSVLTTSDCSSTTSKSRFNAPLRRLYRKASDKCQSLVRAVRKGDGGSAKSPPCNLSRKDKEVVYDDGDHTLKSLEDLTLSFSERDASQRTECDPAEDDNMADLVSSSPTAFSLFQSPKDGGSIRSQCAELQQRSAPGNRSIRRHVSARVPASATSLRPKVQRGGSLRNINLVDRTSNIHCDLSASSDHSLKGIPSPPLISRSPPQRNPPRRSNSKRTGIALSALDSASRQSLTRKTSARQSSSKSSTGRGSSRSVGADTFCCANSLLHPGYECPQQRSRRVVRRHVSSTHLPLRDDVSSLRIQYRKSSSLRNLEQPEVQENRLSTTETLKNLLKEYDMLMIETTDESLSGW